MLEELYLQNFVIFAQATLPFGAGLNVISGETGAGKSLLASATATALGARANQDLIRNGADRAIVKAVFTAPKSAPLLALLRDNNLTADDALIFERQLRAAQSARLALNGAPLSAIAARAITDFLLDLAAQNEHTQLTDPAYQRELLDRFGKSDAAPYREKFTAATALLTQLEADDLTKEKLRRERERRQYQLQKIQEFNFDADNDLTLTQQIAALTHEEQIQKIAAVGLALIDEDENSLTAQLGALQKQCAPVSNYSPEIGAARELCDTALTALTEAARQFQNARDRAGDAADIDTLIARSEQLKNLLRLLDCRDAAELPALADALAAAENSAANAEFDEVTARKTLTKLGRELAALGAELRQARVGAAKKLAKTVNRELRDLEMPQANFSVRFIPLWESETAPTAAEVIELLHRATADGLDDINFLIAPNPGEAPSTLAETASGGEAARAMLAIKSALASAHNAATLFFDEIDSGVGGRLGDVLGRKLRELSRARQVIVITHLPQIAAYADRHLKVVKTTAEGRTTAQVQELSGEARTDEIAQMINGAAATAVTRQQAQEMLAQGKRQ